MNVRRVTPLGIEFNQFCLKSLGAHQVPEFQPLPREPSSYHSRANRLTAIPTQRNVFQLVYPSAVVGHISDLPEGP